MSANNRPLAFFGIMFFIGQFALIHLPSAAFWLSTAVLLLCAVFAAVKKKYIKQAFICFAAICAAGINLFCFNSYVENRAAICDGNTHTVCAVVCSCGAGENKNGKAVLEITQADGEKVKPFKVYAYGMGGLEPGDVVLQTVRLERIEEKTQKQIYYPDKILFYAQSVKNTKYIYTQNSYAFIYRLKQSFYSTLCRLYSNDILSVQAAVTIGEKEYISPSLNSAFRLSGLSHMLCVSGLHLAVTVLSVYYLLKKLLNYKAASAISAVLTVLYAVFIGFTPSIARAALMLCAALLARLTNRRFDFASALSLSSSLLIIANPYMAVSPGFLLSFFATAGVYCSKFITRQAEESKLKKPIKLFLKAAAVPLCAMLATLPVQAYIGGTVSVIGILVNMACVWLLSPMLILSYISVLFYKIPLIGFLSKPTASAVKLITSVILRVVKTASGLGGAFNISGAFAAVSAVGAVICGVMLWKKGLFRRAAIAVFTVLFAAAGIFAALNFNAVRIAAVGAGNSVSVSVSVGGKAAVVLCGGIRNAEKLAYYAEKNNLEIIAVYDINTNLDKSVLNQTFLCDNVYSASNGGVPYSKWQLFDGIILETVYQGGGACAAVTVDGNAIVGLCTGKTDWQGYEKVKYMLYSGAAPKNAEYSRLIEVAAKNSQTEQIGAFTADNPIIWLRRGRAEKLILK